LPLVLKDEGQVATFPSYLTDYSDAIAASDDATVIAGLLNHARCAPNGYRRLVLSHIRRDSNCMRAMQVLASDGAFDKSFQEIVRCYYLRLPARYEDFLRTKDSRFRRRLKRLQSLAGVSSFVVRELTPDSFSAAKLPEVFLSLHLERQKVKSCFEPAAAQAFTREVISDLFQKKIIRACALMTGEKVVAVDLYTMGNRSLGAWNGGFLDEANHCSPGKLLIDAGVKLACALKLDEYDFMRGTEGYKASWANESRSIGTVELSVTGKLIDLCATSAHSASQR
jgi:CelD/BcsL family acetyltransferase involved in cellulose biosynthesis